MCMISHKVLAKEIFCDLEDINQQYRSCYELDLCHSITSTPENFDENQF